MLEKTGLKEIVLLKDRDTSEIRDKCLELFSQYISSLNPNKISSSGVDVEQIINDYRDRKFPFEEGKNEEFKDAIMISSIKQFFKMNECTIVTSDKGFRRAFDGLKNFHIFCELEELFDFINKNNGSEVYEFVRDNKKEIEKYLREQIENFSSIEVENAEYDRKGCPDDYEFDDYEVDEINVKSIDEPKVLETLEDKARLSCRCVVEFSVRGKVIDYPSAIWDSEEHRYIVLPKTEYDDKYSDVEIVVNFTVVFNGDEVEFSEFKTDDVILLNRYNRTYRKTRESGYPYYEDDWHDFD